MRVADIAVVGAGPAGCAAAIVAARAGLDVVLIDKSHFPRDKCCGDGLTASALRELQALGLVPADVASWQPVSEAVLHSPSHRRVELSLPDGQGLYSVVARRRDLDAALVDLAVAAGARLLEGESCDAVRHDPPNRQDPHDDVVVVTLRSAEIRARTVVAADGMWSPLRKLCGAPHTARYRGEWHAFRQYFSGATGDAARRQHVWFPADLLPAYVWSFPLPDGRLNVGFGVERAGRDALGAGATLWQDILGRKEVRAVLGDSLVPDEPMRAWPIPARIDQAVLTALGGRVLFVGDAATAADPMTGEGIGQALLTGRLAAEAVTAHRCSEGHTGDGRATSIGTTYRAAVRRELVADHRLARGLSRVLRSPRGAALALRLVDTNDWTRGNFARWMFEDYPRALLATPRRWRRGGLHQIGAYPEREAEHGSTLMGPTASPREEQR